MTTGTYSNVSNHPRLLRIRDSTEHKPAQIRIDDKTGFPVIEGVSDRKTKRALARAAEDRARELAELEEEARQSFSSSILRSDH